MTKKSRILDPLTGKHVDQIPLEAIVTDDIKKLAGEFVQGDPTVIDRAIKAQITINLGVALMTHFKPEYFDKYSTQLQIAIQNTEGKVN